MLADRGWGNEAHFNAIIGRFLTDAIEEAVLQSLELEHPRTLAHMLQYFVGEVARMSTRDGIGIGVLYTSDGLDLKAMKEMNPFAFGEALQVAVIRLSWRLPTMYQAYCETVNAVFRRPVQRRGP